MSGRLAIGIVKYIVSIGSSYNTLQFHSCQSAININPYLVDIEVVQMLNVVISELINIGYLKHILNHVYTRAAHHDIKKNQ